MQPNARLHMEIEKAKQFLGWASLPKPVLALHIRHGKWWQNGEFLPTEDYFQVVRGMVAVHGYQSLFVMTDDQNVTQFIRDEVASLAPLQVVVSLDAPSENQGTGDNTAATSRPVPNCNAGLAKLVHCSGVRWFRWHIQLQPGPHCAAPDVRAHGENAA
jgi:hypothetical protein